MSPPGPVARAGAAESIIPPPADVAEMPAAISTAPSASRNRPVFSTDPRKNPPQSKLSNPAGSTRELGELEAYS